MAKLIEYQTDLSFVAHLSNADKIKSLKVAVFNMGTKSLLLAAYMFFAKT